MTRIRGRSLKGTRLIEHVPHGSWKTTTFVGAIRASGWLAPLVVDGAINGSIFLAWVEQHLVRAIRPGDIVIMDNTSVALMMAAGGHGLALARSPASDGLVAALGLSRCVGLAPVRGTQSYYLMTPEARPERAATAHLRRHAADH